MSKRWLMVLKACGVVAVLITVTLAVFALVILAMVQSGQVEVIFR